jgi:dipeptidyl aminopeptidase/acylaminoacyl peptidase
MRTIIAKLLAFVALAPLVLHCEPLSLEEIIALERVSTVRLSPDGRRIAYLLQVARRPYIDDDGPAYRELHVTDLDANSRGYVTGEVEVTDVAWSTDGATIYYLAQRGDDEFVSIHAIAIDGGESRKLYQHVADIEALAPSPDGRRIAFLATGAAPDREDELETKGFKAEVYEESEPFVDVWMLDTGSEELRAMSAGLPGSASELAWSPDGERYVVALAPTPSIDDHYVRRKLHVVAAADGRVTSAIEHVGKLGTAAWSPDGTRIAFVGALDQHDPLEGRVFVASADGESLQSLTPDYPGHIHEVAWRDDDTLWYRGSRGVWSEVDALDVGGRSLTSAVPPPGPIVRDFDARPDLSTIALVAETPQHPPEVFVWHERDGYRRLTDSNPVLVERDLAPQEPVRYRARDGVELEGILVRPLDERLGHRYPLVIVVHGGPEGHYSQGWLSSYATPAQTMAGRGYALFYPNYRASTGRGVEFSQLDHGDPAGAEFDDLVDAKEHLVSLGLADSARVGITGASYGGYATMWAATALSEHFAAGVAFVGISDTAASLAAGDIPHELYLVHLRRWPWEDWMFFLERSPIYHAAGARTPLLILAGDRDPRVDPSQSLMLYRHIKLRTDTPVRLVWYPGEGHGNRNTAAQLDYAMRFMRWMDHYLQGAGEGMPPYAIDHAGRLEAAEEQRNAKGTSALPGSGLSERVSGW